MDAGDGGGGLKARVPPWEVVAPPWGCRNELLAIVVSA